MTDVLNPTLESNNIPLEQSSYQQQQITMTQSNITKWTTDSPLPIPTIGGQVAIIKDKVYLFGGYNSNGRLSTVLMAPIIDYERLGRWTINSLLPAEISDGQIVMTKNRIYLIGGITTDNYFTTVPIYIRDVYTAPIYDDGSIGKWRKSDPFPIRIARGKAAVIKNKVYLFGGNSDRECCLSTIYTATIRKDGRLGKWALSGSLPMGIINSQVVVTKNRVYLLGGETRSGITPIIFTAVIKEDGSLGKWETDYRLPVPLFYSHVIVRKNKVYLLGKHYNYDYSNIVSSIFIAPINDDGELGQWTTGHSMPKEIYNSKAIIIDNKLYLLGGENSTEYSSKVYTASLVDN